MKAIPVDQSEPRPPRREGGDPKDRWLWPAIVLLVAVRCHNAWVVPPEAGYDPSGHLLYLQQLYRDGHLPDPRQGWMDYQPPAYYVITVGLARLLDWGDLSRVGIVVSALASLVTLGLAWRLARRLAPGTETLAVLLLALVPANLIMGGVVGNMALAAMLSALFLERLAAAWDRTTLVWWAEGLLGALAGLAFLGRLENLPLLGLVPLLALARLWKPRLPWRDTVLALALASTVMVSVAAVYLLPNLARFDRPIISNNDPDIFPYFQTDVEDNLSLPGFHTVRWFTLPDAESLGATSFPGALPSLWATTYESFWDDYFGALLPYRPWWMRQAVKLAGLPLLVLLALGIRQGLSNDRQAGVLVAPLLLSLTLYTLYQVRLPEYWCDKAVYCAAAYMPGSVLIASTVQKAKGQPILYGCVLALGLLVACMYWL